MGPSPVRMSEYLEFFYFTKYFKNRIHFIIDFGIIPADVY